MTRRTWSLLGAAVGFAAFLGAGLLPGLLYGGYAAVALASVVSGGPVGPTLAARGLVVLGMAFGALLCAALFAVAGAAAGVALAVLTGVPARPEGAPRRT
jgi:hypothetical protein